MNCRHCYSPLEHTFLDLGFAPPSNAYLSQADLTKPEIYYPLKLKVCTQCWLVQTEDYAKSDELFLPDYAYFSSTSSGWLTHAKKYTQMITQQLDLNEKSLVIEIASNDGYLLKNFVAADIPCLGIEPTTDTAIAAEKIGVPVLQAFFSEQLALQLVDEGKQADLIIANNVYAHVPDINDFTKGLKTALKPHGTVTLEFPHLLKLVENTQFDTIYHEHFSYLSLYTTSLIFKQAGLKVFAVEQLSTHGGSLRIYGCHQNDSREIRNTVKNILAEETLNKLQSLSTYQSFQNQANKIKNELLDFLLKQKKSGKNVLAYGAAAKGNTLLNYAGVKPDLIPMVCDAAPAKQGRFMPGSHIPIMNPKVLHEIKPDIVLVLPWNIIDEVAHQHSYIYEWSGQFVSAIPEMNVFEIN